MKFKKVGNKDIRTLAILASEIWHEYWPCILSNDQINYMVDKFQSEQAISEQIKNEQYSYYFIDDKDKHLGYMGISSKNKDYLFLSKLYLKKECRHLGYGKKVFEEIKLIALNLGYNKIQLTVNKYNKNTIDAYLKYGFKTINSIISDIGSGFVMDDYIMEYSII